MAPGENLQKVTENLQNMRVEKSAFTTERIKNAEAEFKRGNELVADSMQKYNIEEESVKRATMNALIKFRQETDSWKLLVIEKQQAGSKELDELAPTIEEIQFKWERNLIPNTPEGTTTMEYIGQKIEFLTKNFDKFQTKFAYLLAPLLEPLQKLKIPGFGEMQSNIDMIMGFLGMERTMLFAALRKQHIDPAFNTENPDEDSAALERITTIARELHKNHSNYPVKAFLDASAISFANHLKKEKGNRKVFSLTELAEYAEQKVKSEEEKYASGLKPAENTENKAVTLKKDGENIIAERADGKKITIKKLSDGKLDIQDNGTWQLTAGYGLVVLQILTLEKGDNDSLTGTIKHPNPPKDPDPKDPDPIPFILPKTNISEMFSKIDAKENSYKFKITKQDGKELDLEFKKIG